MGEPRQLSTQDLNDLLNGACILGSGGGGPLTIGSQIIAYLEGLGAPVLLADPDSDVADDQTMAVSAVAGSPDAAGDGSFPMEIAGLAFDALNTLRSAQGDGDFAFVLPGEVGAGNSLIPMTVAAQRRIPVVDAAGARRAIPTLTVCTYAGHRLVIEPLVVGGTTADGKPQIVSFTAPSAAVAEGPLRGIISGAGYAGYAGVAFWAMAGVAMKDAAIKGTTSYAIGLGRALREGKAAGKDPVQLVADYLGGYVLFTGAMLGGQEQTQGGFDLGQVSLYDEDSGATATVINQNENLIAWSDRSPRPLAIAPDLICYLTTDGEPFSNADLAVAKGKRVALIGAPSGPELRSPPILDAFRTVLLGVGYGGQYLPIEELRAMA